MQEYEARRATQAAISSASSLGLIAHDAAVLHNSNKLTLRLQLGTVLGAEEGADGAFVGVLPAAACDVLARVAPTASQCAQFEVDVAQRLAEVGSPVAALQAPEVFARGDYVVTLWATTNRSLLKQSPTRTTLTTTPDGSRTARNQAAGAGLDTFLGQGLT